MTDKAPKAGGNIAPYIKSFVERVERLEEEKKTCSADIRDVYVEAKGAGLDVKALRAVVRLRKMDKAEREALEEVVDSYMHALGLIE